MSTLGVPDLKWLQLARNPLENSELSEKNPSLECGGLVLAPAVYYVSQRISLPISRLSDSNPEV